MKIGIIVGSTRDGRLGERVSKWVSSQIQPDEIELQLLDVAEFNLPVYSDSRHPAMMGGEYPDEAVQKWADAVAACEAFIFVTPEYNHSIPAALKNALDSIYGEWSDKPAAIVSYSATFGGGVRAAEHLRNILAWLGVAVIGPQVAIDNAGQVISEDGEYDEERQVKVLAGAVDKLTQWAGALNGIRQTA
jgi:NAD(P)H-dependent FMN reductase